MAGMTVAELVARLRAETGDFTRGMSKAERELSHFGSSVGKMDGALGKMAKGAAQAASGIGLAFAGASALLISKGMSVNAMLEKTQLQFNTLMGDADKAEKHVRMLFDFAAETPFETAPILQASRMMQTFGGAALNTEENIRMVGDAAAAASADIGRVAFYVGRAYGAIQAGRPIGEAAMYLQEMSILSGVARNKLEQLQETGASSTEQWEAFTAALKANEGAMKVQAQSWEGLTSTFADLVDIEAARAWEPMFLAFKEILKAVIEFAEHPIFRVFMDKVVAQFQKGADVLTDWSTQITGFINDSQKMTAGVARLSSYVGSLTDGMGTLVPVLAMLTAHFAQAGLSLLPIVGKFFDLIPFPGLLGSALIGLALGTEESRAAMAELGKVLTVFIAAIAPAVTQAMTAVAEAFAEVVVPMATVAAKIIQDLTPAAVGLVYGISGVVKAVAPLAGLLARLLAQLLSLEPVVWAVVAGFAAWQAIKLVGWIGGIVSSLTGFIAKLTATSTALQTVGMTSETAARQLGGGGILGALRTLNPWVVGIAAVASGATIAFNAWAESKARARAQVEQLTTALKENKEAMAFLLSAGASGSGPEFGKTMLEQMNDLKEVDGQGLGDALVSIGFGAEQAGMMIANAGKAWHDFDDAIGSIRLDRGRPLEAIRAQVQKLSDAGDAAAPIIERLFGMLNRGEISTNEFRDYVTAIDGVTNSMPDVVAGLEDMQRINKQIEEQETAARLQREADAAAALAEVNGTLVGSYQALWATSLQIGEIGAEITKSVQGQMDPMKSLASATDKLKAAREREAAAADRAKDIADARLKVTRAEENLAKARASTTGDAISEERALADAREGLAEATKSVDSSQKDAMASLQDWVNEMKTQAESLANWKTNLRDLAAAGFGDLAVYMAKQGPESAGMVQQMIDALAAGKSGLVGEAESLVIAATTASQNALASQITVYDKLAEELGTGTVDAIAEALGMMPEKLLMIGEEAGDQFGVAMVLLDAIAHNKGREVIDTLARALGEDPVKIQSAIDGLVDLFSRAGFVIPVELQVSDPNRLRELARLASETGGAINVWANANGNIMNFGRGSENHVAQIAGPGALRVWAEPETGGEAYIPLSPGKRGRSMSILEDVARRFGLALLPLTMSNLGDMPLGFADGGIVEGDSTSITAQMGGGRGGGGRGVAVHHHYHNPTNEVVMGRKTLWTLSKLGVGK